MIMENTTHHSPPILYLKNSLLNLPPVARQIWLADAIMNTPVPSKVSLPTTNSSSLLSTACYPPPNITLTKFRSTSLVYVLRCSSSWLTAGL